MTHSLAGWHWQPGRLAEEEDSEDPESEYKLNSFVIGTAEINTHTVTVGVIRFKARHGPLAVPTDAMIRCAAEVSCTPLPATSAELGSGSGLGLGFPNSHNRTWTHGCET